MWPTVTALVLACATLSAAPASGQRVEILRPDTLGANFDATKTGTATFEDYKYLEGSWTVKYQARNPVTGVYQPPLSGTWKGVRQQNGIFQDDFELVDPIRGRLIATYRAFDPAKSLWTIQGIATGRGAWQAGIGWSDGTNRYVVQDAPGGVKLRIKYYSITGDHFLWRADASNDGGKTWLLDTALMEATRAKAP